MSGTQLEKDKPKNAAIAGAVGVVIVLVVGIVVGVQILFEFTVRSEIQRKVLDVNDQRLAQTRATEQWKFTTYQWVEKDHVARIPLEQAVKLTLRDWPSRPESAPALAPAPVPLGDPTAPSLEEHRDAPTPAPAAQH